MQIDFDDYVRRNDKYIPTGHFTPTNICLGNL